MNNLKSYWYIVAPSHELKSNQVLSKRILGEDLVAFRGSDGKACIMPDRCLHRCAKLSKGQVHKGQLICPYHGWIYNDQGKIVSIPAHAGRSQEMPTKSHAYPVVEQDGYIYVFLEKIVPPHQPYTMPKMTDPAFKRVRLVNHFNNTLANCVENFIDIPHTAYVHRGIFRQAKQEKILATITRNAGHVQIDYHNEKNNLGSFAWLLNPHRKAIVHQDNFYAPNVTHVIYTLPDRWAYMITSQSVPVSDTYTTVYTEICYNFGMLNYFPLTKWMIKRQAQRVIDQDVEILAQQMEVIQQYGEHFWNTSADIIHQYVSEIIQWIKEGKTIDRLSMAKKEITFWV